MKRLRAAIARFFGLSDPKGCAYGEPRCPGGKLCRHDRAEIRHDPSDIPIDEQHHRYAERTMSARELQAKRAREGKPYLNERGQLVDPFLPIPDEPHLYTALSERLGYVVESNDVNRDWGDRGKREKPAPLPIYRGWSTDCVYDPRQIVVCPRCGSRRSFTVRNLPMSLVSYICESCIFSHGLSEVDRERQVDELTAGSTDAETRSIAHDALDDAFIDALDGEHH